MKAQPRLRVYVLCAGILYGNGERVFYEHFRNAWLQSPAELPYIGKGDNLVPTIHVIDLARLVKRIVNKRPNEYYIFAVDRTKKPTMKNIVEAISNGIGTGKTRSVNIQEAINDDWAAYYLNIKMRTSAVFKDEEPPEDAEDPEEAAKKLRFPWHCENGIPDNVRKLNEEFN